MSKPECVSTDETITTTTMTNTQLTIAGCAIKTDEEGRYCLNDFHKAAGEDQKHRPKYWLENEGTKALIAELEKGGIPPVSVKAGRNGGTTELIHEVEASVIPQMCGVSAKAGRNGGTFVALLD